MGRCFKCTPCGWCCSGLLLLAVALVASGYVAESFVQPNGDLGLFYATPVCASGALDIAGRGTFYEFAMRSITAETQPGTPCPASSSTDAAPAIITMEPADGYREGAPYSPVVVMPAGAYGYVEFNVTDATGRVLLEQSYISLGPDDYYPWTVDAATSSELGSGGIAPTPNATSTPVASAGCSNTCNYANDGDCDDGGAGSEFTNCVSGQDCTDCGTRATRRAMTDAAPLPSAGARHLLGLGSTYDDAEPLETSAAGGGMAGGGVAPGARVLLKGGTTGGGYSGGATAGSSGARWGSASAVSRRGSTTAAAVSTSGRSYGGRSTYVSGGRTYYSSPRGYYYSYGARAYPMYYTMLFVGPWGYGCYSCSGYRRNCYNCAGCNSRTQCGGSSSNQLQSEFDRYEIELEFSTDATWPLQLTVTRADLYLQSTLTTTATAGGTALYFSFFTTAGDAWLSYKDTALTLGWVMLVLTGLYIVCKRKELCGDDDDDYRTPRVVSQRTTASVAQPIPTASGGGYGASPYGAYGAHGVQCTPVAVAQPAQAVGGFSNPACNYGQAYSNPSLGGPSPGIGMPVATGHVATGLPQAYPTQPYPGQPYPAQAYPAQAMPVATPAYPGSYPPSPPSPPLPSTSHANKEE